VSATIPKVGKVIDAAAKILFCPNIQYVRMDFGWINWLVRQLESTQIYRPSGFQADGLSRWTPVVVQVSLHLAATWTWILPGLLVCGALTPVPTNCSQKNIRHIQHTYSRGYTRHKTKMKYGVRCEPAHGMFEPHNSLLGQMADTK
jgi:hypothetical protein